MSKKKELVFVAMSGGVDSSVAALLLHRKGYDVLGVFMRCYNLDGCAERDAEDARRVAEHIGIPFYVWDFEEEYKRRVVEYMVEGYRAGLTPNPDIACNREIKFGLFLDRALRMGADYVATGHYVKLVTSDKKQVTRKKSVSRVPCPMSLFVASDENKDQSYFLWTLMQKDLAHCLFPVGGYKKSEIRAMARKAGLPTAEKKDSQGICFLGKVTLDEFLREYISAKEGDIVAPDCRVLGKHEGAHFYTVGQRHGVFVGGKRHATRDTRETKPHYVAAKDITTNTLLVVEGSDHPALYKKEVVLTDVNFVNSDFLKTCPGSHDPCRLSVFARVRYRQPLVKASIINQGSKLKLVFEAPVKFVAPGQSAVFYSKNREMLGGGVIE